VVAAASLRSDREVKIPLYARTASRRYGSSLS
jgi:hypothetical protein